MFRRIQKLIKTLETHNKRGESVSEEEKKKRIMLECKASARI